MGEFNKMCIRDRVTPISITEDAYAGKPNPHAWMSPSNVQKMCIRDRWRALPKIP